ncbi:MAG: ferrochelatase, partial [Rhodobacteraceae bacterium]|nr:ferrochelatase [Paracoccaceae bacterium]
MTTLDQPGTGRLAHAPADHVPVARAKVGVLIANLGTPDHYDYWSMRRYLNEFLSDKRVIDIAAWKWQPLLQAIILTKRPFTSGANYKSIWNHDKGESPLMTITKAQTAALAERMQARFGDAVQVDFCMRYGNPSTRSVVDRMVREGCEKILFFPLYPQYAGATTATANDQFFRALMGQKWQPAARTVPAYFDDSRYIEALAQSVERAYAAAAEKPEVLVASYHGMPQRYLREGDPYHCQCQKTTRLLRERLGWGAESIHTSFQSVFGREEWLRPYTVQHVARLAESGVKRIAVIAPAFAADCIETLEE